jgi:hypothetical protein
MKKRHEQKFVIISLALLFLFNMPLLLIFDASESLMGYPIIYVYIFSIWLAASILSWIIVKKYVE